MPYLLKEMFGVEETLDYFAGMRLNDFIETFGNTKKRDQARRVSCLNEAYIKFNRKRDLNLKKSITPKNIDEINNHFYKQGISILQDIVSGRVGIDVQNDPEIEQLVNLKKEIGKKISKLRKGGIIRGGQKLIKEKNKVVEDIRNLKLEKIKKFIMSYNIDGIEKIDELKECLTQLKQHYVKSNSYKKNIHETEKSIIIEEDELSSNVMHSYVWNKDLGTVPMYNEFRCCSFLGNEACEDRESIILYMANNSISFLRFDIGEKSAMAIMGAMRDKDGKKVLLVDSVESKWHILRSIGPDVAEVIEEYAKSAGFDTIIYSNAGRNVAPGEFISSLNDYKKIDRFPLTFLSDEGRCKIETKLRYASGFVKKVK